MLFKKKCLVKLTLFLIILPILLVNCGPGQSVSPILNTNSITDFSFLESLNQGSLSKDVIANIASDDHITAYVPYGTNVTNLIASYVTNGETVSVGFNRQQSGVTPNNFSNPVQYIVRAENASLRIYTVTVYILPIDSKEINKFSFLKADNANLPIDVSGVISSGHSIKLTVPFNTDVTNLVATLITTGTTVTIGGVTQVSGVTKNNFTNDVTYTVHAQDGTTRDYTVSVSISAQDEKDITKFWFDHTNKLNIGLHSDVDATIIDNKITATIPYGANINLVASFVTTGNLVQIGTATQHSGLTQNDFTNPVTYVVTAADGSTKTYIVTISKASSDARDIKSFEFDVRNNRSYLTKDIIANITSSDHITATVPSGTTVNDLVATFATTGKSVNIGSVVQHSGKTHDNFSSTVTYVVEAEDGETKNYDVIVSISPDDAKDITSFEFLKADNPLLVSNITATISGDDITATVPNGTNLNLKATFATTGASVKVGTTEQVSGKTSNDFTSAVTYVVTAADGTTKNYEVTVSESGGSSNKDITKFWFNHKNSKNIGLTQDVIADINGTDITAIVAKNTDMTLVASFTTTGASVKVGTTPQLSNETQNDFTNSETTAIVYTVTAEDSSTKAYNVKIKKSSSELVGINFIVQNKCSTAAPVIYGFGVNDSSGIYMDQFTAANPKEIKNGDNWEFTVPVDFGSSRLYFCKSNPGTRSPITDQRWFTFNCNWLEPNGFSDAPAGSAYCTEKSIATINMNPSYIEGMWIPLEVKKTGGYSVTSSVLNPDELMTCTGTTKPTMSLIQSTCPTGNWGSTYDNPEKCIGMGSFCDTGLSPIPVTDEKCLQTPTNWFATQIATCITNHPVECANIGNPEPIEIYNSTGWFSNPPGQYYSAALNRGVVGNAKDTWKDPNTFYPANINANSFSAWIHDSNGFGCKMYGFSYDDTSAKEGGDVTVYNCPSPMTVTINLCPWG